MKRSFTAGLFAMAACIILISSSCISAPSSSPSVQPTPPVTTPSPIYTTPTPNPAPTQSAPSNPKVSVSPATGPVGTVFSLNLNGFLPGSWVLFTISKSSLGQLISDGIAISVSGDGRYSLSSDLFGPGTYACSIEEPVSRRIIPTSFSVTSPVSIAAVLSVTPASIAPGSRLAINGKGFSPQSGAAYTIFFGSQRTTVATGSATIGTEGQFTITPDTAGYTPGTYVIEVQDGLTRGIASTSFTVALAKPQSWLPIADNLSNPASGWKTITIPGATATGSYEAQGYTITASTSNSLTWLANPSIQPIADFSLELQGQAFPSVMEFWGYGVIFRFADINNYYLFLVDPSNGSWSLQQRIDGKATEMIVGWVSSDIIGIGPNTNRFKVVCQGLITKVYINGHLLATNNASTLGPGLVSPVVNKFQYSPDGKVSVLFNNFALDTPPVLP